MTILQINNVGRVRVLTMNRPEAYNAFNEALYDAATEALIDAASDDAVAVVVITGIGKAFSAGADLIEMGQRLSSSFTAGQHGFTGFVDQLIEFPKPLIAQVNGLGVGIGATMLALCDLVFMSTAARLRFPFTRLGLAPEAASSNTLPSLIGRQNATWALLSSEWLSAQECLSMGLAFRVCEPDELEAVTMQYASVLASKPIVSLVASKHTIVQPMRTGWRAAMEREIDMYRVLLGAPANVEALRAFGERREPDFSEVDDSPGLFVATLDADS